MLRDSLLRSRPSVFSSSLVGRFARSSLGLLLLASCYACSSESPQSTTPGPDATQPAESTVPGPSTPAPTGSATSPQAPTGANPTAALPTTNAPPTPSATAEPPAVVPTVPGGSVTAQPPAPPPTTSGTVAPPTPSTTDAAPPVTPPPAALLGDVALSVPSQAFAPPLEVQLSTTLAGAEIRYTIDGTLPTASSPLYAAALTLADTTQLRAQAFVGGASAGTVTTGLYIARSIEATSSVPIVVVDGYGLGKSDDKEVSLDAAVMVFEPVDGVASLSNLPTLATRAGYHVRGQSSAGFPQTPYKIEFWDNANQDVDLPLMGMPADSDWALIPAYYDRTLIRNPFIYELGREIGLKAPRWAYVELYLNYDGGPLTEAAYQGVYWFTETIKNNKVRTDLKQLKPEDTALPDISGGYIFKFDQAAAEEPQLTCSGAEPIAGGFFGGAGFGGNMAGGGDMDAGPAQPATCWVDLEVIDPDGLNAEQAAWLTEYLQQFHDGLHATPMADYAATIDVASFVDYLIINELSMNVDSYVRSAYYHKDRDGLLTAGPLWDYNFALGGVGAQSPLPEEGETGWMYSGSRNVNNWYPKLTSDAGFMALVKTRYTELRQGLLSQTAVEQRIDALAGAISEAVPRDFAKWPVADIITSDTGFTGGPTVATWDGQVQVMRDFVVQRLEWMDANLP